MTDRVISVRLQIEVDQARRNQKAVADGFRGIANAAENAGKSDTFLSRLGSSAKSVGKAVATAGGLAIGGMAALGVATVKGGVAYNTLEQTSRAALKTVLGSASAASAQMERLREFGKSSPFPRQVWISAQQQLLAFGMSAEKIIPTFQAIQDAVAASGGGSQQITEVVDVLAKVQSTGKVTAETLNELGYRGIDAATLIGQAMGKTAAEVRDDIQSQAIGGVQFIDMLTNAMETRFSGAAANVKQTWAGAKDRIKGAVRDIGSILAAPLVDPEGGGAAVEWANAVADALRALEARLGPVIEALRDRADPVIRSITAKLEDLADWIKNVDLSKLGDQFKGMLPAIAGVSSGLVAMTAKSIPGLDRLVGGLKPLPIALASAALASPELRQALFDLLAAAAPLITAVGQASQALASALGPALAVVAALLQPIIAVVQFLGYLLSGLPAPVQAVVVALGAILALGLAGKLQGIIGAFQNLGSEIALQRRYAEMAGTSISNMGAAYEAGASRVKVAAVGIRGAMASATSFLAGPWGAAIGVGVAALSLFSMSQEQATETTANFNLELDRQTGSLTGASIESIYKWASAADTLTDNGSHVSDILRDMGVTARDLTGYLVGNADATRRVEGALAGVDSQVTRGYYKKWLQETKGKIDDQKNALRGAADANDQYGSTADSAASSSKGLAGALGAIPAAAGDASTMLQQMQADLQAVFDTQFGLQSSQDKFQSGFNTLRDKFASNHTAVSKSTGAADKYSDSLKRQAKIIQDTKKQLDDLAESQRQAEKEAREAAEAAKQRSLDELFGKQFDVASTTDEFRSSLAQAAKDIKDAQKDHTVGAVSLTGNTEGALANRDRMRSLVQQAQAVIQAEKDQGASKARIAQVTKNLSAELANQAKTWGLNANEVKMYSAAIGQFGGIANKEVKPNLAAVRKEFAEQRAEIQANSKEQLESARASGVSAAASGGASAATKIHTAALKGNSESAIENREWFRQQVKAAQDELTQMKLNGAGKDALTKRGKELAGQLEREATQLGFNKHDVALYTDTIKDSAIVVRNYPSLNVRANTSGALTTVKNFVVGVNRQLDKITKNYKLGISTGSEYVNTLGGGHQFARNADGGPISGPGGPRDDKILSWLSNGEFVVNARDTGKHRPLLEAINSGKHIEHMPAFAKGGAVGKVDPVNLDASAKFGPKLAGKIASWFRQDLFGGIGAGLPSTVAYGGGVERWAPLVLEVLKMLRQPSWLLSHVLRRMMQESGGNPAAINLWDSNAKRGTPSIGLMQTIGPTFAAYAGPFRARGIYDPLANIFAGLNYALHRYGSIQAAMDKAGGYKDGGPVEGVSSWKQLGPDFMRGSFEKGTDYVPMTGMYQLHRGERVVPASQNGPISVNIHVSGDGTAAAAFVVDTLNKAQKHGRVNSSASR